MSSHQSSACFHFFLRLACFEYFLLASEENEKDREVSLLVLLSEACSESPPLSEPSAIFLYESVTDQSPHDFGQREPIERDKQRMFLRGFPSPQSFLQQNKTCNTPSFKKLSYDRNKNGMSKLVTFSCRGARLTRETKILHQGGIKFTREFSKKTTRCQGGQKNSPGRVPPGL